MSNNQTAIDFLQRWRPGGPWVLTAITVDKKSISTRTFREPADALAWLVPYNGQRNIYFHVNSCVRDLASKANREDVASLDWLHVDIDPRAGEDIQSERDRALSLLQDPPQGVPLPTVIVFSGGGFQGFWKLAEPFPIDGDLDKAEEAKLYNVQLEMVFGADNCHNVDRIMRLPGTVNLPDARKKKKGRQPELARLIEFHDDRVYPLSRFTKSRPIQSEDSSGHTTFSPSADAITVPGNIARLSDIEELNQWNVPDRVKVICVQGRHPDEAPKEKDDSRSAWLFDAICNLVRCQVPDEVIYSVVTDPDFGISESVLDKGTNTDRYARKQIASAKEFAESPELARLNQRFAVIENYGGRCRVMEDELDPVLGRTQLITQSFSDFKNRFMHIQISVGTDAKGNDKFMPLGTWWLQRRDRRQYRRVIFSPDREYPGAYNLWRGFTCEARPGACDLYLDHLRDHICGGNQVHFDYLIRWMARVVQFPATRGEVAIVMRGKKGVGKGAFAKHFGSLFGRHYLPIANPQHLVGNFNAHLRDCVLLFGDEAFFAGDKKHESILKTYVTEELITVEVKYVDIGPARNFLHIILSSNEQWVVPAGGAERRYFVLDVADGRIQDHKYFAAMQRQMDGGGREALLHHLLTIDLSDFEVRKFPRTEALNDQKVLSLSPLESWWYTKLSEGILLKRSEVPWPDQVEKERLLKDYIDTMKDLNISRRSNETILGKFLKQVCPEMLSWQGRRGRLRPYFFTVPPLDTCRAGWEAVHGDTSWPSVEQRDMELPSEDEEPF